MFDFIRAACAVPTVSIGDVEKNTEEIINKIKEISSKNPDIIVFPELCLTGYTCADLFFQRKLLESVRDALNKIVDINNDTKNIFVVGAPLLMHGQLYNCAVVIAEGKIKGIVPKTFIPNYNEFYEKRWFSSSCDLTFDEIESFQIINCENYLIPVGRNIIFNIKNEVNFGIEICEDLWTPVSPGNFLSLNGAELIINLSASNETIAKRKYRRELVMQQSARCFCGYVYTSSGACESTTDLIFSGHCLIAENGKLLIENSKLIDDNYFIVSDIDIEKIKADRLKFKTFKDAAVLYGKKEKCISVNINTELFGNGDIYNIEKQPFVPSGEKDRRQRCLEIFEMQVAGLKKRLTVTGSKTVVGVSGGLDSTLALLVCTKAMQELDRPVSDVIGITMPCFGTTDRTYNNSLELMRVLGITLKEINIKESCKKHFDDIGHDINNLDVTYENCQARERTQVLMDYSGEIGGFVVGTGDLSELALGWCTYNADHMSMYGVNVSIPKTLVKWMVESICQYDIFPKSSDVLTDIIMTPISPELLPPDKSGNIKQKTEDIIGPYELHDFFLYNIIRFGFSPEKIYYLAKKAFKDEYENEIILKWLKNFYKRFFTQQFKRSCLPDGIKIGSICLSPRGDWRMPSDAVSKLWLDAVSKLN